MDTFTTILALVALLAGVLSLVRYTRHDGFAPSPPRRLDTTLYRR